MYKFDESDAPFIDLGNGNVVRLEREELNAEEQEKAERELRETEENKRSAIKELTLLLSGKI